MQHDFILLDRSGSMGEYGKWTEAINAVNNYVKKLAEDKVDTGVTLAAFDLYNGELSYTVLRNRIIPSTWSLVGPNEATPRGSTPLNDAIGRLVADAKAGHNGVQYEKVAVIIMTDGWENASREVTTAQAKALLQECWDRGWQIVFLGADYDNMLQGVSYGNAPGSTLSVGTANLAKSGIAVAESRTQYGLTGQSMSFTDEQKRDLASKQ